MYTFYLLSISRYTRSMSKETSVFFIGVIVLLSPFLGIPRTYHEWLSVGCGVVLMVLGYALRRKLFLQSIEQESGERRSDAFVENTFITREKNNVLPKKVDMV